MKRVILALAGLSAMFVLVACGEAGELSLEGPDSVASDDFEIFTARVEGAAPLLGMVQFRYYVDIDKDGYPDTNEGLGARLVAVDRFGIAKAFIVFAPDLFFSANGRKTPDSTTIIVKAWIYWSNLTEKFEYDDVSKDVIITSPG